jgi:hypothetical protein
MSRNSSSRFCRRFAFVAVAQFSDRGLHAGAHALPGESQWAGQLTQVLAGTASLPPERRGKELIKHAYRAPFWGGGGRLESRMWPLLVAMQRREPRVQRST